MTKSEEELSIVILQLESAIHKAEFCKEPNTFDALKYHLDGITRALMIHIRHRNIKEYLSD